MISVHLNLPHSQASPVATRMGVHGRPEYAGTGHFASGTVHCPDCCVKKPDSNNPQYYHQLLACCLVKPGKKEVLPFMPEPIIQQAG